jgi:hypothetical protein
VIQLGWKHCIIFSLSLEVPMKILRLNKTVLVKPVSSEWVDIYLIVFPIQNGLKQGDASSPLFFKSTLEWAIRKVQENQAKPKLKGIYQLLSVLMMQIYWGISTMKKTQKL